MQPPLRKPIWPPSGTLSPQHRQVPDTYAEELVARTWMAVAPRAWGVARLSVDRAELANGVFRVLRLGARTPSGVALHVTPNEPLARSLPPTRDGATVRVHVGLGRWWRDAPSVADDGTATRYHRSAHGTGLLPNLRLLFNDEDADLYERMPLAEVRWAGVYAMDRTFAPPTLRLHSPSSIDDGVREVVAALVERRAELLASREARPLDLASFEPSRGLHLLLLCAVNQALAVLEHPNRTAYLTPYDLHAVLAGLAGALESLDGRPGVEQPIYIHEAPGPGFRALCDAILSCLPGIAREPYLMFPFERTDPQTFSLTIERPDLLQRGLYLVASGADESVLVTIIPAFAKIASGFALPSLVHAAMRGVPVALEFAPPASLPCDATHSVFRLDSRSHHWLDALERKSLMVHLPSAPAGLNLALYAMLGESR